MSRLDPFPSPSLPTLIELPMSARGRFLEAFTVAICDPNTRRSYARNVSALLDWSAEHGVISVLEITTV